MTAFSVAAFVLLGFLAGWMVFRPGAEEISRTGSATVEETSAPPAASDPEVPVEDVPGAEVPGLERYPDSVRTEYRRENIRDLVVTEAEYMVAADVDPVREFYRELFHREGWTVGDLGFFQGEWVFFVIREDHEAIVEITDLGETVEIELELSELSPGGQQSQATPSPEQQAPADPAPETPNQTPAQPAPQQPAPQQPAPQQPAPAPADDDGYDYGDDDDGFDYDD